MANCAYCNSFILFGGVKADGFTFCNAKCRTNGFYLSVAQQIPEATLLGTIEQIDRAGCPKCKRPGPVEVHTAHTVWSAVLLTSWQSRPQVSCRSCGVKHQIGSAALSAVVGWWGFPWGLIMTPVQIGRNVHGMFSNPAHPSPQLKRIVGLTLAQQAVARQQAQALAAKAASPLPPVPGQLPPAP